MKYISWRWGVGPPARHEVGRLYQNLPICSAAEYSKLSERERFVWDICRFTDCFDNECFSTGLIDRFFWNEPGNHALATVEALERIGAKNTAAFLRQACSFFPDGKPFSDLKMRRNQMEQMIDLEGGFESEPRNPMGEWIATHPEEEESGPRLIFLGVGENLFARLLKYWNEHPS